MAKSMFSALSFKAVRSSKKAKAPAAPSVPSVFLKMYLVFASMFNVARCPDEVADVFDAITNNGECLPKPLKECFAHVEQTDVITAVGIYRNGGVTSQYEKMARRMQKGKRVNLSQEKIRNVTSAAKQYIRDLPETVLTAEQQQQLDQVEDPARLREVVLSLSTGRRVFLQAVCAHLSTVTQHAAANKMDAYNIAVVFSPTLGVPLKPMQALIEHFSSIFAAECSDDSGYWESEESLLRAEENERLVDMVDELVTAALVRVMGKERLARVEQVLATGLADEDRMQILETQLPAATSMGDERMARVDAVLVRCVATGRMDLECADDVRRYSYAIHAGYDCLMAICNKML